MDDQPTQRSDADLHRVVAAATVSTFGSMLTNVALPLLAIDVLNASASDMAILRGARLVPGLLFGLAIAAWLDRRRRRGVLITIDLLNGGLLLTILLASWLGLLSIPVLCAFAALAGLLALTFGIARQSYVPAIVTDERLVRANSRIVAGEAAAEAIAFAAGGWLVQLLGAPLTMAIDALSFLGSALCLGTIDSREPAPVVRPPRARRLGAGLRTVAGDPILRAVALASVLTAFANELVGVVYMLFVRRELGFAQGLLGMLFAIGSISALASSAAAERIGVAIGPVRACMAGLAAAAVAIAVLALAPGSSWLGAGAIAFQQLIGDFGLVVLQIHARSLVQRIAPREQLARVNGAIVFGSSWAMLAGTVVGGIAAERMGNRGTLALAALVLLVAAGALVRSTSARAHRG